MRNPSKNTIKRLLKNHQIDTTLYGDKVISIYGSWKLYELLTNRITSITKRKLTFIVIDDNHIHCEWIEVDNRFITDPLYLINNYDNHNI